MTATKGCRIDGCDRPHHGHGLCNTHWMRERRYGDPLADVQSRERQQGLTCRGPECDRPAVTKGLCGSHEYQERVRGQLTPIRQYAARGVPCGVEVCDGTALSEGLCQTHYRRRLRGETDWDRPIVRRAAHGEGHINPDGYRIITVNGRAKPEHRHVMEQILKRRLKRSEQVHHVNGDRADNRTDGPLRPVNGKLRSGNLELWSTSQPAGQEVPAKVAWARELLALYGELVPPKTVSEAGLRRPR